MNKYINKQLKIHKKNLKYDFLPSMIEIIDRPSNILAEVILFLIIALIITIIIWASIFKIDISVTAVGSVMPEGDIATIDSIYGGTVTEVYVEEGDSVQEGDVLFSLDSSSIRNQVSEATYNLEVLQVQREMYGKIYDNMTVEDENDEEEAVMDTSGYGDYAYIADAIVLENEIYKKQLDSLSDMEEREKRFQEQTLSVLQNINTLDVKIYGTEKELENAKNTLDRYEVKAKISGRIAQMSELTKGALVASGEAIGYLVLEDGEKLFNAYVPDEEVGQIHVGDTVKVKIAAYDNTDNEYLEGEIIKVGEISLNIDGIGTSYMIQIRINNLPEDVKIGMEGNCDIIIGQRTVLDYFLEPFKEGIYDSLQER